MLLICVSCSKESKNDLCGDCYIRMVSSQVLALCNDAISRHKYEPAIMKIKEIMDGATQRQR